MKEVVKAPKVQKTYKIKFASRPIMVDGGYVVEYQYNGDSAGMHLFLENDARLARAGYASAYDAALDVSNAMRQNMADDAIVRA